MFSFQFARNLLPIGASAALLTLTAPSALAQSTALNPAADLCYTLALDPDDPEMPDGYDGVAEVDLSEAAIAACTVASKNDPDTAQLHYLLARANLAQGVYAAALAEFQIAAGNGYASAERQLGEMYATGRGVDQNNDLALQHFEKANDLGQPAGLVGAVKTMIAKGGDFNQSLALLEKAGLAGSQEAWDILGQLDADNPGTLPPTNVEAALMNGLAKNDDQASLELARFYDREGNEAAMFAVYSQLTARNNATAMLEMSQHTADQESLMWLQRAADLGEPDAMYELALAYKDGSYGLLVDDTSSSDWLVKAAEAENVGAMTDLGYVNLNDEPFDYEAARAWFEVAADKGSVGAILGLAYIYEDGYGVDIDLAKAVDYYTAAIAAGETEYAHFYRAQIEDQPGPLHSSDKAAADLIAAGATGPVAAAAEGRFAEFSLATRQKVQELLAQSGHYTGQLDGVFGPQTIRAFQAHWPNTDEAATAETEAPAE